MSPLQVLRPQHVIRLTGYKVTVPIYSEQNIDEVIGSWQTGSGNSLEGLLYSEFCRQVPEWSDQASAEMDHPIAYDFLEYAVFEPQTAYSVLTAPPAVESTTETLLGLYTVAFRFAKEKSVSPSSALMFNLFEIDGPPALQQGFLMGWPPRGAFKIQEDAVSATVLHERMLAEYPIAAFNRAEIASAAAYAEGIERFEHAFPRQERKGPAGTPEVVGAKPPIRSHLGLFQIAATAAGQPASSKRSMKVVRFHSYGGPEVLIQEQVPQPSPGPGQILVRVKSSSVNPLDTRMRSGEVRTIYPPWFPDTVGYSISGTIEAVGAGVTSRHIGEEVYGINNPIMRHGYAEYVVGPESLYYPKPPAMDFDTAAAAPSIFATAYGALFGRAQLKSGQRVLIHGGSGVVGSCAVQLAKQAGAFVLATASTKNLEFVKSLGADVVIDYRTQRFEELAHDLDMVLDTVGGETRQRSWALLKAGGVLASLQPPDPDPKTAAEHGVQGFMVHGHPAIGEIMPAMTAKLTNGELRYPEIAAVFPLQDAAKAHAQFEQQPPRGRIVLRCS